MYLEAVVPRWQPSQLHGLSGPSSMTGNQQRPESHGITFLTLELARSRRVRVVDIGVVDDSTGENVGGCEERIQIFGTPPGKEREGEN